MMFILPKIIPIISIVVGMLSLFRFQNEAKFSTMSYSTISCGFFTIYLLILAGIFLPKVIMNIKDKNALSENIKIKDMPKEFVNIYNELYNTNIKEMEIKRKKISIINNLFLISIFSVYFAYTIVKNDTFTLSETNKNYEVIVNNYEAMKYLGIAGTIGFGYLKYIGNKDYKKNYKIRAVSKFINLIDSNLKYTPEKEKALKEEYDDIKFDSRAYDIYKSDDYIEGEIESNVNLQLADIKTQKIESNQRTISYRTLFSGIFGITTTNQRIEKSIKICIDGLNNADKMENKIEMDSAKFEKRFNVYCEDRVFAMRILTAEIMELLMSFNEKYNFNFEICYKENKVYFRIFTGEMFEPLTSWNSLDIRILYLYYDVLKFILDFSKKVRKITDNIEL